MKRPAVTLGLLFGFLAIARLCHSGVVWVEEAYPAAAAIQLLHGKSIYRDFWFDKPPLTPWLYLLWGAYGGVPMRVAGAVFVFACCLMAYRFAGRLWTTREGMAAALLLGFFLTFDVPSAVMALAPDLVMLLPHLAAVYLAWRGRTFWAGAAAGIAMLANPKAVLIVAVCLLWTPRKWPGLAGGLISFCGLGLVAIAATGSLQGYYEQVWVWGRLYSRDTFITQPVMEGLRRTAAWTGFHAAIVAGAGWYVWRERTRDALRFAAWAAIALAGVALGWRFFPRYYFLLLPVVVIPAARGIFLMTAKARVTVLALLLIPLVRFGPRYVTLAGDALRGRGAQWADLAMNQDSRDIAALIARSAARFDTLLVWGYRPDIFLYTRMAAGSPFLDSQPLTGVMADRHLSHSEVSAPELAAKNRAELIRRRPEFIVDGLGPFNPALAIANYPELAGWLAGYDVVGRSRGSVLYRLRAATPPP